MPEQSNLIDYNSIKIKRMLNAYGIEIPDEELEYIRLIKKEKYSITFRNIKTKEIITSDLMGKIYRKHLEGMSILLKKIMDNNLVVEYYNSLKITDPSISVGEVALQARANSDTKLISRAYVNVNTKYGSFCLHLEEGYQKEDQEPYSQVSLYLGTSDQVINDNNDFSFQEFGIFRSDYHKKDDFNIFNMGYDENSPINPKTAIWNFGKVNKNGQIVKTSLYAFTSHKQKDSGIVLIDGSIKIAENQKLLPDIFKYYQIDEQLQQIDQVVCNSKMYFANYNEFLVVIKKGSQLTFEYRQKDENMEWKSLYSITVNTQKVGEIIVPDIKLILLELEDIPLSDDFKATIINQLQSFLSTHKIDLKKLSFTLKPYNIESMLAQLKDQDLSELIETELEKLSELFNIPVEELVRKRKASPNQK